MPALLQEPRLVDNKETFVRVHRLHNLDPEFVTKRVRVLVFAAEKTLDPAGTGKARLFQHHPAGFPDNPGQETVQEGAVGFPQCAARKPGPCALSAMPG